MVFNREVIELSDDNNINQLCSWLLNYIQYPLEFQTKSVIENLIKKISKGNNYYVNQTLGKYYYKYEKVLFSLTYSYL